MQVATIGEPFGIAASDNLCRGAGGCCSFCFQRHLFACLVVCSYLKINKQISVGPGRKWHQDRPIRLPMGSVNKKKIVARFSSMVWFLPVFLIEQTFDEANESKHSATVHVTMCLKRIYR